MWQNKNILNYGIQVLAVFGFSMAVMNLFCLLLGNEAQPFSTLFSLGSRGVSVSSAFQFLGMSAFIVLYRFLFFTDLLIKKMGIAARTACLLTSILITIILFVAVFHWFPLQDIKCWLIFLLCFGPSFILSLSGTILKEKAENKQMEEALAKIKGE